MNNSNNKIQFSVIIPVFNEEENVRLLHNKIVNVLKSMGQSFEVIFVDDGSTDKTFKILKEIKSKDKSLKLIKFRRNFGQSAAMAAGFEQAKGRVIITMDGDLQNDPKDIPQLLQKLEEGYDIVSGWRKNRKDKFLIRKVPSRIANSIIRYLTRVPIHDTGCSLKVYQSDVIQRIRLYGELHRFLPTLARMEGARITEMEVTHYPRRFGKSKYNITRTFKVMMDLITLNLLLKYINNPLYFFGGLGFFFLLFGFASIVAMGYSFIVFGFKVAELNVLAALAFLLFATAGQLLLFGLVANMVVKTGEKNDAPLHKIYSSPSKGRLNVKELPWTKKQ